MKILLTATVQSHICQFHRPLVETLRAQGDCEIHVAARNNLAEKNGLKLDFADKVFDVPFERSPFSPKNIRAYREIRRILAENQYDYIHCNTPVGGVVTRLAARKLRKKGTKVFYTAHGFHFYKGAPLVNWLLFYPLEKLFAHYTDKLITINQEDFALAQKKMKAKEVLYVPGVGIDVKRFRDAVADRCAKRGELGVPDDAFLLLSVGELNKNKNHQIIIKAMAEIPNTQIHYAIAGGGPLKEYLENLARELGVADRVHLLGYRRDVAELYKVSDVFCFPSFREGLSVAVMEAMASGIKLIVSNIRGNTDMVQDQKNGLICPPDDLDAFVGAIRNMMEPEYAQAFTISDEYMRQYDRENIQKLILQAYDEA